MESKETPPKPQDKKISSNDSLEKHLSLLTEEIAILKKKYDDISARLSVFESSGTQASYLTSIEADSDPADSPDDVQEVLEEAEVIPDAQAIRVSSTEFGPGGKTEESAEFVVLTENGRSESVTPVLGGGFMRKDQQPPAKPGGGL